MVLFLLIHDFDQERLTYESARASWFVLISQNSAEAIDMLYVLILLHNTMFCYIYGGLNRQITHYNV